VTGLYGTGQTFNLTSSGTLQLEVLQSIFSKNACGLKYENKNASLNNDEPFTIFVLYVFFLAKLLSVLGSKLDNLYVNRKSSLINCPFLNQLRKV